MEYGELSGLANKLRLLQELKNKLLYVQWSWEPFVLLSRILQDTSQTVKDQPEYTKAADYIDQLQTLITTHLSNGNLPQGEKRGQLIDLMEHLLRHLDRFGILSETTGPVSGSDNQTDDSMHGSILLVARSGVRSLRLNLEHAGFQVWHCETLEDTHAMLLEIPLVAALIDLDLTGSPDEMLAVIKRLDARIASTLPIFFLAERGDFAARLDAVQAGAAGYFTKPVDSQALLDRLHERLFNQSLHGGRVLIINDNSEAASEITQELQSKGIITHIVGQPQRVIQSVYQFQPQLLILDLGLKIIDATDLAKVIRQHESCSRLPMLVLTESSALQKNLAMLGAGEEDILAKPLSVSYLLAVVSHRLRQANRVGHKLESLSSKDTVSNLYHRRYFLSQLEHSLPGDQTVAVILINLENLRVLENTIVGSADKVVELAAGRVQQNLGSGYQASRFGDTIFAVLARGMSKQALLTTARALRAVLENETYAIGASQMRLYVSIGISSSEDNEDHEGHEPKALTLISNANLACDVAREREEEHIHIYNPQTDQQVATSHQQKLLAQISKTVEQQRMRLVFQPIVNLRENHAEHYEVLLRLRDEKDRELLPEIVFTSIQKLRLGLMLDRWVIAHCLPILRNRRAMGLATRLFINLSPAILQDKHLTSWLQEGFSKAQVEPGSLIFELPEATVAEHLQPLQELMIPLKKLGCGLSLDHFGRHSNHSLQLVDGLREVGLAVDYVKLDPVFIHALVSDENKQKQLQDWVNTLKAHKVKTIAGSIEDLPTLNTLMACGIEYAQGYFLQRPQSEMNYDVNGATAEHVANAAGS